MFNEEKLVNTSPSIRLAIAGAMFLALAPLAALAQTPPTKQPPRLPANASESAKIPAGVNTGSPTTSSSVPLGTPVPPDATADRVDQRTRSAAARAAARPDPLTRTGAPMAPAAPFVSSAVARDAARPATTPAPRSSTGSVACGYNDDPNFRSAMAQCTGLTDRSARSSCVDRVMEARRQTSDAPVALPDSGFLGGSASPRTAADLDKNATTRRGCV